MKRMMKCRFATKLAIMMLCVTVPAWAHGQSKGKKAPDVKTAPDATCGWSEKDLEKAGKQLADMNRWQKAIDEFEKGNAELEKLRKEADSLASVRKDVESRLKYAQGVLKKDLCSNKGDKDWFKNLYADYDTVMLLQVKGHLGDKESEKTVSDLLACHRAEALLSKPYASVSERVVSAAAELDAMAKANDIHLSEKSKCSEIATRLKDYGRMTGQLKTVLDSVCKKNVEEGEADIIIKNYLEGFYEIIETELDSKLFAPDAYPYLYGVLMETMKIKIDDPTKDIKNLIDKL